MLSAGLMRSEKRTKLFDETHTTEKWGCGNSCNLRWKRGYESATAITRRGKQQQIVNLKGAVYALGKNFGAVMFRLTKLRENGHTTGVGWVIEKKKNQGGGGGGGRFNGQSPVKRERLRVQKAPSVRSLFLRQKDTAKGTDCADSTGTLIKPGTLHL